MSSLNKIILVGTVAYDPDIKLTTNDNTVAKFTLSVERPSSSENMTPQKDLIPIVGWNKSAEYVQNNINKGDTVFVSGRISERTYEDNEGNRKWITEVESREIKKISGQTETALAEPSDSVETSPSSNYDFTGTSFPEAQSQSPQTEGSVETKSDFNPVSESEFEFNDPFSKSSETEESNNEAEVPF